jgi:hypothetical protein
MSAPVCPSRQSKTYSKGYWEWRSLLTSAFNPPSAEPDLVLRRRSPWRRIDSEPFDDIAERDTSRRSYLRESARRSHSTSSE